MKYNYRYMRYIPICNMDSIDNIDMFEDIKFLEACKKDLISSKHLSHMKDMDEGELLMFVSEYGYLNMLKVLLDEGVDINTKNKYGHTAITHAIVYGKFNISIINALIEYGADVNVKDYGGIPLLHHAASCRDSLKIVKILIENGADVTAVDLRGHTFFDYIGRDKKERMSEIIESFRVKNIKPAKR